MCIRDSSNHEIVTIEVEDSNGAKVEKPLTVEIKGENEAPKIETSKIGKSGQKETKYRSEFSVSDEDTSDQLRVSLTRVEKGSWLEIESLGANQYELIGTPSVSDIGVHKVKLSVSDERVTVDSEEIEIRVVATNKAPEFKVVLESESSPEDTTYSKEIIVSDNEGGDTLRVSIEPSWISYTQSEEGNLKTIKIEVTPTNDKVGVHRVTISIDDSVAEIVKSSYELTITNENDKPEIEELEDPIAREVTEDKRYEGALKVSDIDSGDQITEVSVVPNWLSATLNEDGDRLIITGTRTSGVVGIDKSYDVKVTAKDIEKEVGQYSYPLVVKGVNDNPVLEMVENKGVTEGETERVRIQVRDEETAGSELVVRSKGTYKGLTVVIEEVAGYSEARDVVLSLIHISEPTRPY